MISSIMKALERNTSLLYLRVQGVDDSAREALETGLPKLGGLQALDCRGLHLTEAQQPAMLEAFKRNTSIHWTLGVEEAFLDNVDKMKLKSYASRNKKISVLLENPDSVPLSVWPKIFATVQQTEYGSTIIFSALQKLAGHICQENPSRKRRLSDV
jgi:hypothetical protein